MIEELERFNAVTDSGDIIVIRRMQDIRRHRAESGIERIQLLSEPFYLTDSDRSVRQLDAHAFEIIETNEIVRKV